MQAGHSISSIRHITVCQHSSRVLFPFPDSCLKHLSTLQGWNTLENLVTYIEQENRGGKAGNEDRQNLMSLRLLHDDMLHSGISWCPSTLASRVYRDIWYTFLFANTLSRDHSFSSPANISEPKGSFPPFCALQKNRDTWFTENRHIYPLHCLCQTWYHMYQVTVKLGRHLKGTGFTLPRSLMSALTQFLPQIPRVFCILDFF